MRIIYDSGDIRYRCPNAEQVLDLFETSTVGKEYATEYVDNMTHYNKKILAISN
ncbi:hypothetical protein J5I95_20355 [Candidatus Poribacteria bacterium]|nr:hypothetical protein [Candidatus Poribacteria bacterium]